MLSDHAKELVWECEREISEAFRRFDAIEMITQERVLNAFREEKVSARHFAASNGYGYDDIGRDTLDRVYAHALQAEAALVRPQIVNGTHAIYLAVASNCPPGSKVLSVTGEPYDTLGEAFGIRGSRRDSLKAGGIDFVCLPMNREAFRLSASHAEAGGKDQIRQKGRDPLRRQLLWGVYFRF